MLFNTSKDTYLQKKMIRPLIMISLINSFLSGFSEPYLKKDEDVLFFPISAIQETEDEWRFRVHSWIFEKEEHNFSQMIAQKGVEEIFEQLGAVEEDQEQPLLKQRLAWFLVDNQRNKSVEIGFDSKLKILNKTSANGHAYTDITLKQPKIKAGEWLKYTVSDKHNRNYSGEVQFIPEEGLSVISDIDDTIKISNVLDKKELIINTFVKPFEITKGFPEYDKKLQAKGAYFHYVSASPWQLYPSLEPFLEENYPKGTIALRDFRFKDSSLLAFLKPSTDYKIAQIKDIISRYPKHQFILIGDSGEHDPEIYAEIYKQFSRNIEAIQIRKVESSDLSDMRFNETFKDVPNDVWELLL